MGYVIHTSQGSFCSVCQSVLSCEEIDWDTCDACGGEGIGEDDDFDPFNPHGSGPVPIEPREG